MKKVHDKNKLLYYIKKYDMKNIFQQDMTSYMELHLFDKNEYICKDRELLNYFYFLVSGKTKVYNLLKNGKSILLRFYRPLNVIGDIEFVSNSHTSSNIQAVEKTLCIAIPINTLTKYALKDTVFLTYIIKSLGDKLEKNSRASSINLLYPLENRLASYILATSSKDSNSNIEGISTYKLTEMADLLGSSYRHLLRTINKLCKEQIIEKCDHCINILDIDKLTILAGDLYK
ncbi:cyclic nucleotide-binding domain-containing protein [Clostridium rectalis]|uniref:cyclic nucleotide-binding domain-containing protein n=1 Tax=Clostridium rectalis TaxID=2040295 RepID=UPI000F62FCB4|nr:cyclic nucleotide-binding domain-containing protein [Clostridium rectalis]